MNFLKFASIDIGSNAIRLLINYVYETQEGPIFQKASLVRVPVRLGEDSFIKGSISAEKIDLLVQSMKSFFHMMKVYEISGYRAYATSAMREASNANEVIRRVYDETSIMIEVISGEKEANLISSKFEPSYLPDKEKLLFVDVGGGSTELTLLKEGEKVKRHSFPIGTLRVLHDAVSSSEWDELKDWLNELDLLKSGIPVLGSGGNINKILKMKRKKPRDIHIRRKSLLELKHELAPMSIEERMVKYLLNPDRADVIVPAAEIFLKITRYSGTEKIYVPKIGLSDGIVRSLYKAHKQRQRLENY
jgi:exopolyphosphatase/guanosine-5'-triphosphate,3'-diphosphate pyrophosphatase